MAAANWIPIRPDLWTADEVGRLAELTGLDVDTVVGKLVRVWGWFDSETTNGAFKFAQMCTLDRIAEHEGFARAMREVDWLTIPCPETGAVCMPRFDSWHTESQKARLKNAKRMRRERAVNVHTTCTTGQDRTGQEKAPHKPPKGGNENTAHMSELETALVDTFGVPTMDAEKRRRKRSLRQLNDTGATPADVAGGVANHKRLWPGIPVTEASLLGHWAQCRAGPEARPGDL